jgi:Amylo-alpha-1,6-glucosidase
MASSIRLGTGTSRRSGSTARHPSGPTPVVMRSWQARRIEPGANTTYVRYRVRRARGPVGLSLKILVNHDPDDLRASIAACCPIASPTPARRPSTTPSTRRSGTSRPSAPTTRRPTTTACSRSCSASSRASWTWHCEGTRYGIRMDHDGLLASGEPGVQLTWMDAKIGDWVAPCGRGSSDHSRSCTSARTATPPPHCPLVPAAGGRSRRRLRRGLDRGDLRGRPALPAGRLHRAGLERGRDPGRLARARARSLTRAAPPDARSAPVACLPPRD